MGLWQWTGAVICVLLVIVGIAESQLGLPASISHILSFLLILAGVAWALRGPQRLRRLSELYLWLAFVLSLGLYEVLSNRIAALIETNRFIVYCVVSAIHLLLIIGALGLLGAWTRGKTPAEAKSQLARLSAGLFIVGAVIFWIGATSFPGMRLEGIAANPSGHFLTSATFLVATVLTLAGLSIFTLVLREAGDRARSLLGLMAFLFGAVFWVIHLAFRLTVMISAGQEMAQTGVPPPWYEPWYRWSGLLFGIYHVLAYLALVAYGAAVLKTALLARWVGWISMRRTTDPYARWWRRRWSVFWSVGSSTMDLLASVAPTVITSICSLFPARPVMAVPRVRPNAWRLSSKGLPKRSWSPSTTVSMSGRFPRSYEPLSVATGVCSVSSRAVPGRRCGSMIRRSWDRSGSRERSWPFKPMGMN